MADTSSISSYDSSGKGYKEKSHGKHVGCSLRKQITYRRSITDNPGSGPDGCVEIDVFVLRRTGRIGIVCVSTRPVAVFFLTWRADYILALNFHLVSFAERSVRITQ